VLSQAILLGFGADSQYGHYCRQLTPSARAVMYFRDTAMPCNKREPGTGCSAIIGSNRMLAILGTKRTLHRDKSVGYVRGACRVGSHDPCARAKGVRAVPIGDFHLLPGNTPNRETVLDPGDLITHVTLPPPVAGSKQVYLKLRDRASYEFALASAAVVISAAGGKCDQGPHRSWWCGHQTMALAGSEAALAGNPRMWANFRKAAKAACANAKPQTGERVQDRTGEALLTHALQTAANG